MDARFFQSHDGLSLAYVLSILRDAHLIARPLTPLPNWPDPIKGLVALDKAGSQDLSFFHNARYAEDLAQTNAGLVLVPEPLASKPHHLGVTDVHRALALVGNAFLVTPEIRSGIDETAQVDSGAQVDPSAQIGPFVSIGPGAEIGAETVIEAQSVIGSGVILGRGCHISPHVTLSHALIGDRVHVKPGARIGQRGFGWALSAEGHVPKPQVGRVLIGDDVEIGANTTIDRGSVEDTIIGAGSVIDNLCHIGHNCRIGRYCAIAGNTAFAGTTVLEDFVKIGGAVASKGHVRVGQGATVRIDSLIGSNIPPGADVAGRPARPIQAYHRLLRHWSRQARGAKGG